MKWHIASFYKNPMKYINTTFKALTLSLLTTPSVFGEINTGDFLKFSGIVTTRYEFRETDPLDPSHALTARARVGLTLGEFNGFSAFVEGEGTQGIIEAVSYTHLTLPTILRV